MSAQGTITEMANARDGNANRRSTRETDEDQPSFTPRKGMFLFEGEPAKVMGLDPNARLNQEPDLQGLLKS